MSSVASPEEHTISALNLLCADRGRGVLLPDAYGRLRATTREGVLLLEDASGSLFDRVGALLLEAFGLLPATREGVVLLQLDASLGALGLLSAGGKGVLLWKVSVERYTGTSRTDTHGVN